MSLVPAVKYSSTTRSQILARILRFQSQNFKLIFNGVRLESPKTLNAINENWMND